MDYYFISGTSSGIGKALVEELLKSENSRIVGFSRRSSIEHPNYCHQSINLGDLTALEEINFPKIEQAARIVLVNNAGTLGVIDHAGKIPSKDLVNSINVNFTSLAYLTNEFINKYQDVDCEKVIINITSGAATTAYDGWSAYSSTKAAVDMYTKVLVEEQSMKEFPILTFGIAPGVVDTNMQTEIRGVSSDGFTRKQKFNDLKEENKLYNAKDVGVKLAELIKNPRLIEGTISRLTID